MNETLRRGTVDDAPDIANFQVAMAMETESKTLCGETVLTAVKSVCSDPRKGFYLVADHDNVVVGSLLITYEWSDWRNSNMWYIQSVFVDPQHRRKGVFQRLYHKVVELAKSEGVSYVRLYVETENENAQRTYERLGMKRMPYVMYDVKISKTKLS